MNIQGQSASSPAGARAWARPWRASCRAWAPRSPCFDRNAEGAQRVAADVGGLATVGDVADSAASRPRWTPPLRRTACRAS
jgi:hypothetical protein